MLFVYNIAQFTIHIYDIDFKNNAQGRAYQHLHKPINNAQIEGETPQLIPPKIVTTNPTKEHYHSLHVIPQGEMEYIKKPSINRLQAIIKISNIKV